MSVTMAPLPLGFDLVWVPLLPQSSVPAPVPATTRETFRSLGHPFHVRRIGYVMEPVTTKGASFQSTLLVHGKGDGLKMIRVDTATHPASMIDLKPRLYGASVMNPEPPGGDRLSIEWPAQDPVPIAMDRSLPDPTSPGVDNVSGPVVDEGFGHIHHATGGGA